MKEFFIVGQSFAAPLMSEGMGSYALRGIGPGEFELNGQRVTVTAPTEGRVYAP